MRSLRRRWSGRSWSSVFALAVLGGLVLMAVGAPWITPFSPHRSAGPALVPPSSGHWLGTDVLGLDLWTLIVYGARVSLLVALSTALLAGLGGAVLGMLAGFRGGWLDAVVMRLVDVFVILPELPLIIVITAFAGPSLTTIIVVLAIFSWSRPARIARAQTLSLKEQPYIRMAQLYGGSSWYILVTYLVPETLPILMASMLRLAGRAVVLEASMAFLGLGDPMTRSWGQIINRALDFPGLVFTPFWRWWLLYPWLFLVLLVGSLAVIGREMERIADTRLQS